ncbi:MAG: GAF domain-containing protein [Anaerolineae bacterium]|nr:GAF domain-containing protein [Anaerolineae bacterium]
MKDEAKTKRQLIAELEDLRRQLVRLSSENGVAHDIAERQRLAVLSDLSRKLASALDLDAIMESVYQQVRRVFDTRNFYIALYTKGNEEWTSAFHIVEGERQPPLRHSIARGLTGYIIRTQEPLLLANLEENTAFLNSQGMALLGDQALSWMGVPLITADEVVGVMAIESYTLENLYSSSDLDFFTTIARQVADAIQTGRLFDASRKAVIQLRTAAEVSRATSSILDPEELLPAAVEVIQERFDYYYVGAFLVDVTGRWAELHAGTGAAGAHMLGEGHRLAIGGTSMIGACIAERRARIALDVGEEAVRFDNPLLPATRSEMALPLISRGEVLGALTVQSVEATAFSEGDISILQAMADQLANTIANARLFNQAQRDLAARESAEAERERILAVTQALYTASRQITTAQSEQEILEAILVYVQYLDLDRCVAVMLDRPDAEPGRRQVKVQAVWDRAGREELHLGRRFTTLEIPVLGQLQADDCWVIADLNRSDRVDPRSKGPFRMAGVVGLAMVPLSVGPRVLGWLFAETVGRSHAFSDREVETLRSIASQGAVALENLRRLREIARREIEHTTLIDNIPDTIYYKDTAGRFVRVNPAQAQMLGASSPDEVVGKTDFDFFAEEFASRAFMDEKWLFENGESLVGRIEQVVRRDGESRWVSATKIPLVDSEGEVIGLVGISRDITELKLARDQAQRRATQLQAITEVSRAMSSILNLEELLPSAVKMIRDRFGLAFVGLYLLDDTRTSAVLRAGTGTVGRTLLAAGYNQAVESTALGACIRERRGRILYDVGPDAVVFDSERFPETRSELLLPLMRGDQALGLIQLHSAEPEAFAQEDTALLQNVADQLSNAVEIARLLEESAQNVQQLEAAYGAYTQASWQEFASRSSKPRGYRFRGFDIELADRRTPEAQAAWREGKPVFTVYESGDGGAQGPRSVLAVPIKVRDQVIGVLNLRSRSERIAPDAISLLEQVATRLGLALESARLLEDTRSRAAREQLVGEITSRVRSEIEVEAMLERALSELGRALDVQRASVQLEVER